MVSISTIKSVGNVLQRSSILAARNITPVIKDISKITYAGLLQADTAVFSGVKKALSNGEYQKILSKVLDQYNSGKLLSALKRGRTTQILHNWKDIYGVKNAEGVFQNAINKLKEKGGAIDTYLAYVFPKINDKTRMNAKNLLEKYLEKNLDIYTYDRIENILKDFSGQIKKSGKNPVVYVPDEGKSYGIISSLYKRVNPDAKIVTGWKNLLEYSSKNPGSNVAIFDDCIMSGKSVKDVYNSIRQNAQAIKDIDFYVCTACEKGINDIKQAIPKAGIHFDGPLRKTLEESDFFKQLAITINGKQKNPQQNFLKTMLRCQDTTQGYYTGSAVMFPYMAPNNNSIFAANMIESLFSGPKFAIKNAEKVAVSKEGILEYPPKWLEAFLK